MNIFIPIITANRQILSKPEKIGAIYLHSSFIIHLGIYANYK